MKPKLCLFPSEIPVINLFLTSNLIHGLNRGGYMILSDITDHALKELSHLLMIN